MKLKKISVLLLCTAVFLSSCAKSEAPKKSLSLWCVEAAPAVSEIYTAAAGYEGTQLIIRSFPDEAALADALNNIVPDMLLCSEYRARLICELGLASAEDFLPIGYETQLLISSEADSGAEFSLEGKTLSSSSYADTMATFAAQLGEHISAVRKEDISRESFVSVYNSFAEAAYAGRLVPNGAEAQLRFVSSSSVPAECENVRPFPVLKGGEKRCHAVLYGILPLKSGGRSFSTFLAGCALDEYALSAGLIPFRTGLTERGSAKEDALLYMYANYELAVPSDSFFEHRPDFDAYLLTELERLAMH